MTRNAKNIIVYAVIVSCLIILGIYFRLYPVIKNPENQDHAVARLAVYLNIKKDVAKQIAVSYPAMPPSEKNALLDRQFKDIIKNESGRIEKIVSAITRGSLTQRPDLYLLEADPYHYYHLTKRLLKNGRLSDTQTGGWYYDTFIMAPTGHWRNIEILPYIGVFAYRAAKLFYSGVPLVLVISAVPLVIYALCLIMFISFRKTLGLSRTAILAGGLLFSLSPVFIQRSAFGWYDTDAYNTLFFLATIFLLLKTVENDDRPAYRWSVLLACVSAVFSIFWQGWILLPVYIALSFAAIAIYRAGKEKGAGLTFRRFSVYCIVFCAVLIMIIKPSGLARTFAGTSKVLSEFMLLKNGFWPDIFITIGELKASSPQKLTHLLGGYAFILSALFGLCAVFFDKKTGLRNEKKIILLIFFSAALCMTLSAERFLIFLLVPAAICSAIGIDIGLRAVKDIAGKVFKYHASAYAAIVTYVLIGTLSIVSLVYAHVTALNQKPIFNAVWQDVLKKIRLNTPENSIISSWWCPGHFIKAVAERPVTLEGAHPNIPQAYWMASFFLATEEDEAIGILRMLDSSGNEAAEFLVGKGMPLDKAIALLKRMVVADKQGAGLEARSLLSQADADHLVSLTHGKPAPAYCLIYKDLADSVIGLYYVKNWDFAKAADLNGYMRKQFKKGSVFWRGSSDNVSLLWSIAGGMTYIGEESYETARVKDIVYFADGVMLDSRTMDVRINGINKNLAGAPESVLYEKDGILVEKRLDNPAIRLSVLLIRHPDGKYSSIIAPRAVLTSVLFRLYYLNGVGLKCFELFAKEENPVLDTKIVVYKVAWNKE
ncbi:MAG: STT3 domain-containing protein [Candidatus Omnitrophica bacterium]|nr:STT3 domain-containing protein [Candidatus Omnitrophota bacterium]